MTCGEARRLRRRFIGFCSDPSEVASLTPGVPRIYLVICLSAGRGLELHPSAACALFSFCFWCGILVLDPFAESAKKKAKAPSSLPTSDIWQQNTPKIGCFHLAHILPSAQLWPLFGRMMVLSQFLPDSFNSAAF